MLREIRPAIVMLVVFTLITGIAYPLAGPDVQKTLGYDGVQPIKFPAGLVARIPHGSGLDPAAAGVQPAGPALR